MKHPKNPFVYGRILTAADAACPRPELEERVRRAVQDDARLALVGDRRVGKSSLVQRTLEEAGVPMLRISYHEVLDLTDVTMRTLFELDRFLRERSAVAKRVTPWMREVGLAVRELSAEIGGVGVSVSTALEANHLKQVFGHIRDAAKRGPMSVFIDELQDLRDRLPEKEGNAALAIIRDEVQQMAKCPVFFAGSARESFTLLFTSDASPFYLQGILVPVEAIPAAELQKFIGNQFSKGEGIEPDAISLILQIAGDSPNDVQLLCHETWAEHLASSGPANTKTVKRAFEKVLRDMTPYGEKWLSDLTTKQQRIVMAVGFLEHLGASTREFMELAAIRNPGDVERALASTTKGNEALLEKVGSRYRFRSRFARLWFVLRAYRVQALLPLLRSPEAYRVRLAGILPVLAGDPIAESSP